MSVAVVSSIYGVYDEPHPVPDQSLDAEWILITDRPVDAPGWNVIVETRDHINARTAAKVAKCLPFEYTDADTTVWMDGSLHLIGNMALAEIVAASKSAPIAQITHPWRQCAFAEAEESVKLSKYWGQNVMGQVAHYAEKGFPHDAGLFATGLIVRNNVKEHPEVVEFGYRWLAEQIRWTYQDQLSQMPVLWEMQKEGVDLEVKALPFPLHGSGLFEWHPHSDGT